MGLPVSIAALISGSSDSTAPGRSPWRAWIQARWLTAEIRLFIDPSRSATASISVATAHGALVVVQLGHGHQQVRGGPDSPLPLGQQRAPLERPVHQRACLGGLAGVRGVRGAHGRKGVHRPALALAQLLQPLGGDRHAVHQGQRVAGDQQADAGQLGRGGGVAVAQHLRPRPRPRRRPRSTARRRTAPGPASRPRARSGPGRSTSPAPGPDGPARRGPAAPPPTCPAPPAARPAGARCASSSSARWYHRTASSGAPRAIASAAARAIAPAASARPGRPHRGPVCRHHRRCGARRPPAAARPMRGGRRVPRW